IYYKVIVNKFTEPGALQVRCQCPYNLGEICRHEAAALFQLQDLIDKQYFQHHQPIYHQRHTVVKMKNIDLKILKLLTSQQIFQEAEQLIRLHPPLLLYAADETVRMELTHDQQVFQVEIKRNEERYFDTSCPCEESRYPLCVHKLAVFLHLLDNHGPHYFETLRNWDKEKSKLLGAYGYSLEDNWEDKFEFHYVNGKPYLRVLDPQMQKKHGRSASQILVSTPESKQKHIGLVWNTHEQSFPYCRLDAIMGECTENGTFTGTIEQVRLDRFVNEQLIVEEDRKWLPLIKKTQRAEILKYLNKNTPFWNIWDSLTDQESLDENWMNAEENQHLIAEYLHPKLQKLTAAQELIHRHFWLPPGKAFQTANLIPIHISLDPVHLHVHLSSHAQYVQLQGYVWIQGQQIPVQENNWSSPIGFLYHHTLYLWSTHEAILFAAKLMTENTIQVNWNAWPAYLQNEIIPHLEHFPVQFDETLCETKENIFPVPMIQLKELDELLIIQPIFDYDGIRVEWDSQQVHLSQQEGKLIQIKRNKEAETQFVHFLQTLHPQFSRATQHPYFYLKSGELTHKGWILYFLQQMKQHHVAVLGIEQLKHFRFNPHAPVTQLRISSGLGRDWFDAEVEVSFGNQKVDVRDIKKALQKDQNIIPLADGTLGVLSDEWMKKYALLFKMGEEHRQGLKLSAYNFGIIDELYEHIDDDKLLWELEEKKRRLLKYDEGELEPVPAALQSILRPYQQAGFQWLNYLDRVGWGGILADDMGLGKT
ncbi:MAG: DEAD/DEAH box helicase, partial [Thermoflavifilum sp.]|nr:DEAD/DEAH box helicase [Thermoflavifilum sp.]